MSKKWAFWLLCAAGISPLWASTPIVKNAQADYVIAVPDNAHFTEKRAAGELAEYLGKATGAKFEIVAESAAAGRKAFYVGQTELAKKSADLTRFAPEEWLIRTLDDGNVVLTGGRYVGSYYAAVDYLEKQAKVRWLDESCEIVPKNPALETGDWNLQRKPSMMVRQVFDLLDWSPRAGHFKERNKGFSYTQEASGVAKYYGGKRPYHTAGEYSEDWPDKPELFTRGADGKALRPVFGGDTGGQICMSSPEARQRVLDKMLAYIEQDRKEAAAKQCAPPCIYDFSPNDNANKCTCSGCMALAEREGSYSGATIDFINFVARGVAAKYPDVTVKTFAYAYCTEAPDYLKAEPNVMIQIAQLGVEAGGSYGTYDTIRPLEHKVNTATLKQFRKWGEHASQMMHWSYWVIYGVTPEPVVRVKAFFRDLETERECHIKAFFAEYENPAFHNFSALTRYLAFKLTDNMDLDKEALLKEFMTGYYGPAAGTMTKLLDYMEARQDEFPIALGNVVTAHRDYLDDEYFATTLGLLRQAEKEAADSPEVLARVRREIPPVLAGLLERWGYLKNTSVYNAPALIEEFRSGMMKSLDYFFADDPNHFRTSGGSESFDRKVSDLCVAYACETAKNANATLPKGVTLGAPETYVSLCAPRFIHEAKAQLVDDPDAFCGKASRYEYGDEALNLILSNWMEGNTYAQFLLTEQRLPRDGKYHWVKVGRIKFQNNGRAHLLIPPHMKGIRIDFYRKVMPNETFDAYISLKCDNKALACDRMLLVKVNETEQKCFELPKEILEKPHTVIAASNFRTGGGAELEADPLAFDGSAWINRSESAVGNGAMLDFGIYDRADDHALNAALLYPRNKVTKEEYTLLALGKVKFPAVRGSYFYCGADWVIQWGIPDELLGKSGTLYVLVKYTGAKIKRGSQQPTSLTVGGAVFVP